MKSVPHSLAYLFPSPQQIRDLLLARVSGVLGQGGKKSNDILAVLLFRIDRARSG